MTRHADAVAEARKRREAVLATLVELRGRTAPTEIAEDMLAMLDPQQSVIRRIARRMRRNKLLSLAVLAGAAWLAGIIRHQDGKPPPVRKSPRAKPKEKHDDSGQQQRNHRPGQRAGRKAARSKGIAQERRGKARANHGLAPLRSGGTAEPQPVGQRVEHPQQAPLGAEHVLLRV